MNGILVHNSSKLKNERSQISKAAHEFSRRVGSAYLLSGTPAPNCPIEYYGQVRCIDESVFGPSWWRFANTYFRRQTRIVNGREVTVGWRMLQHAGAGFAAKLQSCSWSLRACDCLDLPDETDAVRPVDLSAEELHAYAGLLVQLRHEFDDGEVTATRAEAKSTKLRQVTGGNLYLHDGRARPVGRSKLDALLELLEELGARQVVVWAEFTAEIDRIVFELAEAGIDAAKVDGSVPASRRAELIGAFQAGRLRVLVCHPAAAGHGVTLTAARYDVFYSVGFFSENHEQARKRIHRTGQRWPVTHYYLVARNTIDERVLRVLRGKATAAEAMKEELAAAGPEGPAAAGGDETLNELIRWTREAV